MKLNVFLGNKKAGSLESTENRGVIFVYDENYMDVELAKSYTEGMAKRFPARHLAPFAKRGDCDDVACFEMEKPGKVVIVHDFCDPGYEKRQEYDTFWDWFRAAMEEMITETEAED